MPANYTISKVTLSSPPASNQIVSIYHKLSADPDTSYTLDSPNSQVLPNGNLVSPFTITGLNYSTNYTVKVSNNCGGLADTISFLTPADPCPDILGITGTTSLG